jgi:beta-glucosidase
LAGAEYVGWTAGLYLTENSGSGIVITLGGTKDTDAPWAIPSTDKNAGWAGGVFANAPTTAASFNPDLWHELGEFIGTESLFTGIPFLWGPGLNTHRASYNGRTGEYYSEDGILAGNVAMEYAMGAMNYGLITAPKHFAFNDQETNRAGVSPYMTEQRARETELRAYQIAVEADKYDRLTGEDCGMRGLMTSFSKIGGVEVTCSYGLKTEILQNEWGFHGYAVTDIYDDTDMFASVAASGVTCYDLRGQSPSAGVDTNTMFTSQSQGYTHAVATYQKDSVLQSRMKLAVKNLLWVTAQSNMMNRFNENSYTQWQFTSWRAGYIFISIAAGICVAGSVAMYVLTDLNVFKKKEEN